MIGFDAGSGLDLFLVSIEDLEGKTRSASITFMRATKCGNMTSGHQREIIKIIERQTNRKKNEGKFVL